jgi:small subunit ribosomal protein S1
LVENKGLNDMVDEKEKIESMDDYIDEINSSVSGYSTGDIIDAVVIRVNRDELLVDIGSGMDGIIKWEEMGDIVDDRLKESVEEGDSFSAFVMKVDDSSGTVILSKKKADSLTAMDRLSESFEEGTPVKLRITGEVRGGVTGSFNGVKVFIPISQIGMADGEHPSDFVNSVADVRIIEFDESANKVVASRRAVIDGIKSERRDEAMKVLKIGDKSVGKVVKIMPYGAFVEAGDLKGLIHISDICWKRSQKVSDVLKEGQTVQVIVSDIDEEKKKVSFKLQGMDVENPWNSIGEKYGVGDVCTGRVVSFKPFGAFVEIGDGVEGLVHISNICEERIAQPSERLKIGQEVRVVIISIDEDKGRIGLSIKDAGDEEVEDYEEYIDKEKGGATLGDLFASKLKNLKF